MVRQMMLSDRDISGHSVCTIRAVRDSRCRLCRSLRALEIVMFRNVFTCFLLVPEIVPIEVVQGVGGALPRLI